MSTLKANRQKKWLTCLGCGKRMLTDRCHRLCKKCRRRNNATPMCPRHRTPPAKLLAYLPANRCENDDW